MIPEAIRDKMQRIAELRDREFTGEVEGVKFTMRQIDSNRRSIFEHIVMFDLEDENGVTDYFEVSGADLIDRLVPLNELTVKKLSNIKRDIDLVEEIVRLCRLFHCIFVSEMAKLHREVVDYQIQEDMIRKQIFLIPACDGKGPREYMVPEKIGFFFEGGSLYRKVMVKDKKDDEPEEKSKYIGSACVIMAIGTDINNGRQYYHLMWKNSTGDFHNRWLPCHLFYSKNGVNSIMTITQSCIISENAYKDAIDYFKELITVDDIQDDDSKQQIQRIDIVEMNGWADETYTCMIAGNRTFTADGSKPYTCIDSRYALEFKERGNLQEWAQGMSTAGFIAERHLRFTMDASVASLLLKMLGLPSHILHLKADTSQGKTTTAKASLNLFGDASLLMKSMNGTANGLEAFKIYMNGLPVVFDETTAKDQKDMTSITYRNEGQTKMRANVEGKLADARRATECVTIMTGEASHINSTSYGGEGVRMLEVPFKMKHISLDEFDIIEKTIRTTAGLAFPYIMEALFEMNLDEELSRIEFTDTSNVHNRINKLARAYCVAHIILDRAFAKISKATDVQIPATTYQEVVLPTFDEIKENATVVQDPMHIRMMRVLFGVLQLEMNNEGEKFTETIKDKDGNDRVVSSGDRHITKFVVNPKKSELLIPCQAYIEMMMKYDKSLTHTMVSNALKEWSKEEIGFLKMNGNRKDFQRMVNEYKIACYVFDMDKIRTATGLEIRTKEIEPTHMEKIKPDPAKNPIKFR